MLTLVFMCQPIGQLAATLVALVAVVRQREGIGLGSITSNKATCNAECLQTLDEIWRWIIGVGAIPAVLALWFRLTIIESPRYTADVGGDSRKALSELARYLPSEQAFFTSSSSIDVTNENEPLRRRLSGFSQDSATLRNLSGGTPANDTQLEDRPFEDADEIKPPPPPSWRDFKDYFWHGGNLRTLLATSFCWFCVDL